MTLTISQLNKIGERLRKNQETNEDLQALDDFRLSFESAYQTVFDHLTQLDLKPGGRSGKTTLSIRAKLIRERTRLSRMQDIGGCRVIVDGVAEQDTLIETLKTAFPQHEVFDRRAKPSHGYRAMHLVVYISGVPIEIQIRTGLQHAWAELSEKLSDADPTVKYGGGSQKIREILDKISDQVMKEEMLEPALRKVRELDTGGSQEKKLEEIEEALRILKLDLHELCRDSIIKLQRL